jgi:hypothetical protein
MTFTIIVSPAFGEDFEEKHENAQEVVHALQRLVHGPMAAAGLIDRVKVVDSLDLVCFDVVNNKVVFPPNAVVPAP